MLFFFGWLLILLRVSLFWGGVVLLLFLLFWGLLFIVELFGQYFVLIGG